ncbi:Mu-like prophage protein gp16 [Phaeobacter gallaeciensis]|uniref:regulatory protein GemA n=1 Tax=Phaeobacter gallaeciensis TaxID=60890 RepID=UPI000BBCDEE6|nr:regulatory protein GemA [Phaeobacter gallaeciensis]ATF00765.1 Mu-like prophage protein gp16 [Phaeobacter gallaeciensis]
MNARQLQKQIHVACRDLGLDADARHDIQIAACGKASMRDMTAADLKLVVNHLKERGWNGAVKQGVKRRGHKAAPRADLRLVHVLWRLLGEAGALRDPSRAGLNKFIRVRFEGTWKSVPIDVDTLRDHTQISQIINALKDWCAREGVELNR